MGRNHVIAKINQETQNREKQGEREAYAAIWPYVCAALGKLPPTKSEIEKIKLFGPPEGYGKIKNNSYRYQFKKFIRCPKR